MIARLLAWRTARRQTRSAGAAYRLHEERATRVKAQLAEATTAVRRSNLLMNMSSSTMLMAINHDPAFGSEWVPGEDRVAAMSLSHEAALYRALSDVEWAVAFGAKRGEAIAMIELPAGGILNRMAATPDLRDRIALFGELREALVPWIGHRATRLLAEPQVANQADAR